MINLLSFWIFKKQKWKDFNDNNYTKSYQLYFFVIFVFILINKVEYGDCSIEEIEATPTNTNGIELGELSLSQLVLVMLVFLKLTLLYSVGVLPLEIDLGGMLDPLLRVKRQTDYPIKVSFFIRLVLMTFDWLIIYCNQSNDRK